MTTFRTLTIAVACAGLLTGCGSRLNPMNWFGGSRSEAVTTAPAAPVDGRPLVQQVTKLEVLRASPAGAIVSATGLPATQGYWNVDLVAEPLGADGVLTYRFVVAPPTEARRVSTPQSREVTAGAFISGKDLERVRQVVVIGQTNRMTSAR